MARHRIKGKAGLVGGISMSTATTTGSKSRRLSGAMPTWTARIRYLTYMSKPKRSHLTPTSLLDMWLGSSGGRIRGCVQKEACARPSRPSATQLLSSSTSAVSETAHPSLIVHIRLDGCRRRSAAAQQGIRAALPTHKGASAAASLMVPISALPAL